MSKNDKGLAAATVASLIIVGWIISKLNTNRQEKEKEDIEKALKKGRLESAASGKPDRKGGD